MANPTAFSPGAPPRILVVDDTPIVRAMFRRWLPDQGCACELAEDLAGARVLLAGREFDLLICDLILPDGTGLELAADLPEANRSLPVIFLTGQPTVETAMRSVQLRVVAYLVKPPNLPELLQLIWREVAAHRERRMVALSRRHLREWDADLARLEQALELPEGRTGVDYLRLTISHFAAQLAELDRSMALIATDKLGGSALAQLDIVTGLRHAVRVLEKTRDHFKSKDLGELRKELESLLHRSEAENVTGKFLK